jgi:hypothetical protein
MKQSCENVGPLWTTKYMDLSMGNDERSSEQLAGNSNSNSNIGVGVSWRGSKAETLTGIDKAHWGPGLVDSGGVAVRRRLRFIEIG